MLHQRTDRHRWTLLAPAPLSAAAATAAAQEKPNGLDARDNRERRRCSSGSTRRGLLGLVAALLLSKLSGLRLQSSLPYDLVRFEPYETIDIDAAVKTNHHNHKSKKVRRNITDETKVQQIENYRTGRALMLNIHATHHGGTSFCDAIGNSGGPRFEATAGETTTPSFACWFDRNEAVPVAERTVHNFLDKNNFWDITPWRHGETDTFLAALRPYFHAVSWEYDGVDQMRRNLSETNWEHPHLLSVVVTRDPVSRLLAGGQKTKFFYPGYNAGNLSHAGWWDYATNPKWPQTDNFFFRIVEGSPRRPGGVVVAEEEEVSVSSSAGGNPTTATATTTTTTINSNPNPTATETETSARRHRTLRRRRKFRKGERPKPYIYADDDLPSLESLLRDGFDLDRENYERAVSVLNRFTVVLDIACLSDGMRALASLLDLNATHVDERIQRIDARRERKKKKSGMKGSARERIGHGDVYQYLVEKNKWDTSLYEYSKTISLVDCDG